MAIPITVIDETVLAPNLLWDTTWDGFIGSWAPAAPDEPSNRGGLRARAPLETAILLSLMSDRRADPSDFIPDGSGDPRGWAGDAIDPTIAPLGSRLWQLRRHELKDETADLAELYAQEALQPLIDQGVAASVEVRANAALAQGRLELFIALFRDSGERSAEMRFWLLWTLNLNVQDPLQA